MEDISKPFREAMRHAMAKLGLKQSEVADLAGVQRPYFNKIYNGLKPGTEETRRSIAAALGMPYGNMVELGRKLLKGEDVSLDTFSVPIKDREKANLPPEILALLEAYIMKFGGLNSYEVETADGWVIADRDQTSFIEGARFIVNLEGKQSVITAGTLEGKPALISGANILPAPGRWGPPWVLGKVVLSAKLE